MGRVDAEWVAYMRDHAKELSACARRFLEARGVQAEYRVVGSGSAAHGLDDVAEAEGAAMIVARLRLARRPAADLARLDRRAAAARRDVPGGRRAARARASEPADRPVQRIGVAYVDTPEAREALRVAGELAERTGARLRLFTVVAAARGDLRPGGRA